MIKRLAVLTALAIGSASVAHATSISGYFSATGTDTFNSTSITFNPNTPGSPNNSVVAGAIGGVFASYLTDGNLITFLPGALPYHNGTNTPPNPPYTLGYVPNFFTVSGGGVTFAFNLKDYTAGLITDGSNGCASGATCLDVTGDGFFTSDNPSLTQSGNASFTFTSQYVAGQNIATLTSFSASVGASPVPEPASLALVGSGLLGVFGVARRRFNV